MEISIADHRSDVAALAELFRRNLISEYISHSELQGRRALGVGRWSPDIADVLHREISERLGPARDAFPRGENWQGIVEARRDGALVGMAYVTTTFGGSVPFGIIEDVVIEKTLRGHGLGSQLMRWLIDRFNEAGCRRQFLESGIGNESAHHLFEDLGFNTVSIVMMRDG